MAIILVTGATGTVGSILSPILKKGPHKILYLIRATNEKNSLTRFREIFGDIDKGDVIIEGDITTPHCGMKSDLKRQYIGKIDKIVHCAASIKFDEKFSKEIRRTNIYGTEVILDLANELRIPEIHHISTAYIAGDAISFNERDFDICQNHRNVYESSKMEAERLVRNFTSVRYSIYRLGIIVGKASDGFTPDYNGYYGFLKSLWKLRQRLLEEWKLNSMGCKEHGFLFDENQNLCLPLKIEYNAESTINIVPIDWVAKIAAKLITLPAGNVTYHLTHPHPPKIGWLLHESLSRLKYDDQYVNKVSTNPFIVELQKKISNSVNRFLPYLKHEAKFGSSNIEKFLKDVYSPPPEISADLIDKLIRFALSHNFGIN